mgnify:CR=1 FL=1|jgi:hypothetical protein
MTSAILLIREQLFELGDKHESELQCKHDEITDSPATAKRDSSPTPPRRA